MGQINVDFTAKDVFGGLVHQKCQCIVQCAIAHIGQNLGVESNMQNTVKTVKQSYSPTLEVFVLLETFRSMLNDCIRIGLETNVTSMKSLSLKAYHPLAKYDVYSRYKLTAISAATGILRNYRKAKRKEKQVKEPYAKRSRLVACYGFKIENGALSLPLNAVGTGRDSQRITIPLNSHTLATIEGFTVHSITLTPKMLCLVYAKDVQEIRPQGLIGIDRNLNNVTTADSNGHVEQLDLSEATRIKAQYRETKRHFKRNDARVRGQVFGKYGRIQRNKVQQIIHHTSKLIVEQAKRDQHGIVMENIKNIRKLYCKGNWQGRKYRARMNSWSYYELQRQIEYKARWEGIPVIYVSPWGTSSKCSICGRKMMPEENRTLRCSSCGYVVDRDVNAARNILARGLRFSPVASPVEAMVTESLSTLGVIRKSMETSQLVETHKPTS